MSLQILFDQDTLRPIVQLAVAEALERLEAERAKLQGRRAFTETEAAVLLGVKPHVLRDCRRRDRHVAFEETWIDFINAWPNVKFPRGASR